MFFRLINWLNDVLISSMFSKKKATCYAKARDFRAECLMRSKQALCQYHIETGSEKKKVPDILFLANVWVYSIKTYFQMGFHEHFVTT